jgi:Ca-activated chloride channel family protein
MTDGDNNQGLSQKQFMLWYQSQGERIRNIPVFPILFGEGNPKELTALAEVSGGRLFDSRATSLAAVFREIRGYQ